MLEQQHAAVVASAFATVTTVRTAVTLGTAVAGLVEGQRGPGCPGRLRHVRRVCAVALERLRWGVVGCCVRHNGRVMVDGRMLVVNLNRKHDSELKIERCSQVPIAESMVPL